MPRSGIWNLESVILNPGAHGLEGLLGGAGELGLHLAELLALGLATARRPRRRRRCRAGRRGRGPSSSPSWRRPGSAAMASRLTMFMTLISGLRAGPAVSLSGSPTVSPVTAALCFSEPLPVISVRGSSSISLLGVVPGAAGVGHEHGQELADDDHAGEEAAQGVRARGRCRPGSASRIASSAGPISSCWAGGGADVDHAAVVGLLGPGPDLLVAELDAAFLDDQERRPADGADQHRAEQERHRAADQHADEDLGARRPRACRPPSRYCVSGHRRRSSSSLPDRDRPR